MTCMTPIAGPGGSAVSVVKLWRHPDITYGIALQCQHVCQGVVHRIYARELVLQQLDLPKEVYHLHIADLRMLFQAQDISPHDDALQARSLFWPRTRCQTMLLVHCWAFGRHP